MSIMLFPKLTLGALITKDVLPYKIRSSAPENPKVIPKNFRPVRRSLRKKADKMRMMMGVKVTITPLLIGVESCKPLKNMSILMHIPKKAAKKIRG